MFPHARLQHLGRAILYDSLAQLVDAGVPLDACVLSLKASLRDAPSQRVLTSLHRAVEANEPLSKGLERASEDIPSFHPRALHAAEESGNPAKTLRTLADTERTQDTNRKTLIRRSAYPVLLIHMALLAPAAGALITNPAAALPGLLTTVLLIDLGLWLVFRSLTQPVRHPYWARLTTQIPGLGRATRDREHGRYLTALHQLYEAGIPLGNASQQALEAVENVEIARELSTIPRSLGDHQTMGVGIPLVPGIRSEISAIIATSEPAGELGDGLQRAAALATSQADEGSERVVLTIARTLYAVVVILVIYVFVSFWTGYFNALSGL